MYNQINVDYVALLWEDFMYESDNREISSARKEHMPYLRFTKVIINHFISKYNTILMRNRINLHTIRDDTLLFTLKFVSKIEDYQKYGALIPNCMINQEIKDSKAYKTYLDYAIGKVPPKKARKFKKPASPKLKTVPTSPKEPTQKGKRVKRPTKKATTTLTIGFVIRDTTEVLDEQTGKTKDTSKGTCVKPRVPNMSKEDSFDSDDYSWGNSEDENDYLNDKDNDGGNDDDSGNDNNGGKDAKDSERTDLDDDENPYFTLKDYEEEEQYKEYVHTKEKDKSDDEEKMYEEKDVDVAKELYGDLNITQGLGDTDMTNAKQGVEDQLNASHESGSKQEEDDGHVTLTTVHDKTEGTMQSSSVSSDFTSKLLNLDNTNPDVNEIASLMNTSTVPPPPPLFDQRVSALETKMSKFNQTNQFVEAVSLIPGIVDKYLASKVKEAVDVAVQLQSNKLKKETEVVNQEFFNRVDSTMKAIIKEQVTYGHVREFVAISVGKE
uniref:Uncharacterized protein n=1 Tax=Tanacetum cinerariifolium TaxID=118510 RepID=A0A699JBK8_TANCI|nr:hypothetical protein [Tanacetum cinerariifolium]